MRLGGTLLCILAALGLEQVARADAATAQDFAARATKRAQQGDNRGAIEFLEKAYDADPSPDYILQTAEQYELVASQSGDSRDVRLAISYFRQSLTGEKNPSQVQSLQARIGHLEAQLAASPAVPIAPSAPVGNAPVANAPTAPPTAAAPQATGDRVAIRFIPVDVTDSYYVSAGGYHCTTPCTLMLKPGLTEVTTTGADEIKLHVDIPNYPGHVVLSPGGDRLLAPGIALTVIGPVIAASLWSLAFACPGSSGSSACLTANLTAWPLLGAGLMFTGIGFLAYWGGHRPTTADVQVSATDSQPPIKFAFLGLQPLKNGAATGLGFSF